MCTFDSIQCGGFEALTARGYLWANITNMGGCRPAGLAHKLTGLPLVVL